MTSVEERKAQLEGRLTVRWHVEPASEPGRQQLCVDWRESGVVMPEPGTRLRNGYGRELIERALPYQLGVETSYTLGADGVHCTLCLPIGRRGRHRKVVKSCVPQARGVPGGSI